MAFDLALDYATGDLKLGPNGDFDVRTGPQVTRQRIYTRLKVMRDAWHLDPSGGLLGSHLHEFQRMSTERGAQQVELFVREALEPMEDISVENVEVTIPDPRTISLTISYFNVEEGEEATIESLPFALGVR